MRSRLLDWEPLLLALLVWVVNGIWLSRDTRPPVWDMAMHQSYALNYVPGVALPPAYARSAARSGNYPPFVHWMIALCYRAVHPSPRVAALAHLPATLLLLWAVYHLGLEFAGPVAARWAAFLTAATPLLLWMSRESVLDYWLSAWVAAALLALRKCDGFAHRRESLIFGALLGLGMLTKWLFAGFIFFPLLYVFVRERLWRDARRAINLADASILGGIVAAVWYVPNLPRLARYFVENMAIGTEEGEPSVASFQSLIYYLRLLEGYQLFALLFALTVGGMVQAWRKRLLRDGGLLAAAIAGAWLVLTLLRTKDPRFSMPLLGLVAVPAGAWIDSWGRAAVARGARAAVVALLVVQAYMINFGIRRLPQEVVLAAGYEGSMRWDWNLYLQHYFHILGRPRREDWRQLDIVRRLHADADPAGLTPSLAVVPDMPRLSAANIQLYARLAGVPLRVDHVRTSGDIRAFEGFDYALVTEREQGIAWTTRWSNALTQVVFADPALFRLIEVFPLPNGDAARLYAIQRTRH